MQPGRSFSHTFKTEGSYNYICTLHVTQGMVGKIVVLPLAPVIASPLSATGVVGNPFLYAISASNAPTQYSADSLPPGVTLSGNTLTGAPTQAGTYVVNLAATNAGGGGVKTLTVLVIATIYEPDQDGDGFPDALEIATGSDPANPASTPYGIPANAAMPLTLNSLQIALNFAKPGHDQIAVAGTVTTTGSLGNQPFAVDVGGVAVAFALDGSGKASTSQGSVKLTPQSATSAAFVVKLKGAFASALAGVGLSGSSAQTNLPVSIPVNVLFAGTQFSTARLVSYSAKANKSGLAK
jgi:hypothetical protein